MKRTGKIAVGIDVTETRIHMVVLRRNSDGCTVLDSAAAPVPERVIEDGRITDPRQLARVLKAVRRRRWATTGSIAVSLPPQATLTRIIPLTEQDPQRIGQFVQDEIKQYAILSGRETTSDFRVLAAARQDTRGAVLVAAADHENVTALATAADLARLQIGVVEPAALACARLLCADGASGPADQGLMIVLLQEATLTLCVFRRGLLDFVRTEICESESETSNALGCRIAEEVAAVMRFYSLRGSDAMTEWRVVLADDEHSSVLSQVQTLLEANAAVGPVRLVTADSLPPAARIDLQGHQEVSLAALGLALRAGGAGEDVSSVNLLPPGVSAAQRTRKNMFVMANGVAVVMLAVIVGTGVVAYMSKRVHQNVVAMREQALKRGERSLPATMAEIGFVDQEIEKLSRTVAFLKAISDTHPDVDWVRFLNDIKRAVPPHRVQLTSLILDSGSVVTIRGVAVSADAIRAFVDALNASPQVRHASRREWNKKNGEHIEYEIQCALSAGKVP
jgi:Tfp pilus assembly PilM family ATPase/Tfp pilus assembly protein PilN